MMTRNSRIDRPWPSVARAVLLAAAAAWSLAAEALVWPQEVTAPEGTIVVYQPQPESLKGNVLTGRAAMSLELKGNKEPVFGAFWFTAIVDTDGDEDVAAVRSVKVTEVRWPDSKDADEQRFTRIVEDAVRETRFEISRDQLSASLATAAQEEKSLAALKMDPPKIVFSEQLAVLLLYDGKPRFSPVENSDYERALNTPFVVVRNKKSKSLYLSSGTLWYQARDPLGPWARTTSPPGDLVRMLPPPDSSEPAPTKIPAIVVATEATELIVTDGKPNWKSLSGGQLLYVANTETPWVREPTARDMYLLLSGRWFRAAGPTGPWTFVRADKLPASFKDIPPASEIGGLRASVAGTEEANEAVLDAQIPQTAAINRSDARLSVQYDGAPKFEKIPGTAVSYAVNTGTQVLQVSGRYYAVDNGVWFTSAAATGPWAVADKIPEDEIQKIPPASPVYNTTYVHVYQSTPQVVYVGYTPGYLWSYPYYGVPIYGTGWYYPPYWGSYYYPRPPTWGLHVGYNPWTGWHYGVSWSNGFFSMGVSWGGGWGGAYGPGGCCGGWYGGGYRGPVFINTGNINIGNNISVGNRTDIRNRIDKDTGIRGNRVGNDSIYKRPENRARNVDRATAQKNLRPAKPTTGRQNDVYADKNGTVARRVGDSWETRDQGAWQPDRSPASVARPTIPQSLPARSPSSFDRGELDRAQRARQSGARRESARPVQRGGGQRGGRLR